MSDELNPGTPAVAVVKAKSGLGRTLLVALAAIAVLVALGLGSYAYLSTQASANGSPPPSDAAQAFFNERGNGTPGVFTNTVAGGPSLTGHPPGVGGLVEQVAGNTITVKNPMDSTSMTIQVGPQTVVRKQADVKLGDIKPGMTINALGQKTGEVLAADLIQVGADGTTAGAASATGPLQIQIQPGAGGATTGNTTMLPAQITGTVEKIEGNTITLKTADGTTTVQISANTALYQQVPADVSAIAKGDMVMAQGTQTGSVFAATSIDVSPGGGGLMIRQP